MSICVNGAAHQGLYHLSAAGRTSWHGFASEILRLRGIATPVEAIATAQYPLPAKRPKNSLLDNGRLSRDFGIALPDWKQGLAEVLAAMEATPADERA